jgi:hypothetical protein
MKHLYLIICLFAGISYSYSQDLTGQTITLVGDSADLIETGVIRVKNLSSTNVSMKVRRREDSLVTNSSNYFCWTICYGPGTDVSPTSLTVNANSYSDNFHGYYNPNSEGGSSTITYVFFNTANVNDTAWFTVKYATSGAGDTLTDPFITVNFPASVNEVKNSSVITNAYPNPAKDIVSFDILKGEKVDRVEVLNMLGVKVLQNTTALQSTVNIPVSGLAEGIYFCNFYRDGVTVGTQRFTVSR